mmetsp:Transcript_19336/g.56186  ORF Transcript_19336/g.56186 Transcript_19336/m.56186 type:complete len:727 (-) Transcript_19336:119-2299(-)
MPCTYADETYQEVLRWMEHTPVRYQPNPKKPGSKSFDRYERYSKAKTVGQALRFGSYHSDLLFDYERGHLRATGGPKRKALVDPSKSAWDDTWTRTDKILSTMHRKWISWSRTFAIADRLGVDRRNLTANRVGRDSIELHARRVEADAMARLILSEADRRRAVTDADLLHVLRLWGFKQNTTRQNVMPKGWSWIHSDTLGLISSYDGTVCVNAATRHYPSVPRLMCRWLEDHLPKEFGGQFMFTSINVNKDYATRLHRDSNNDGPSVIAAFGDFTGGVLKYWPEDDRARAPLGALREEDGLSVDLSKNLLMFDGGRGHLVTDFEGERYSVVFFSIGRSSRASEADRQALRVAGIPFPERGVLEHYRTLLAPPLGYDESHAAGRRQTHRTWPRKAERSSIVHSLSEERIREAKDAVKFIEAPKEEDDDRAAETRFVGHATDRRTLEDGRKTLRVYLRGASGRLTLAVIGTELARGSSRYEYRRADSFVQGWPLCTNRLAEVRRFLAELETGKQVRSAMSAKNISQRRARAAMSIGKSRRRAAAATVAATTPPPAAPAATQEGKVVGISAPRRSCAPSRGCVVTPERPSPPRRTPAMQQAGRVARSAKTSPSPAARQAGPAAPGKRKALEAFVACTNDTEVVYAPSAKTAATHPGSYERYSAYSQARTLGEALSLGSSGSDLLYDWQAGFLKIGNSKRRQSMPTADEDLGSGRFGRLATRWRSALLQL